MWSRDHTLTIVGGHEPDELAPDGGEALVAAALRRAEFAAFHAALRIFSRAADSAERAIR